MPNLCINISAAVGGADNADKRRFRIVTSGAAIHRLPLPDAAGLEKSDLGATAHSGASLPTTVTRGVAADD